MTEVLTGFVTLPRTLMFDNDALELEYCGSVELGDFTIFLPKLPLATDQGQTSHNLNNPIVFSNEALSRIERSKPSVWGYQLFNDRGKLTRSAVNSVAIQVSAHESDRDFPLWSSHFGDQFNQWLAIVQQWLELWTGQTIAPDPINRVETTGHIGGSDDSGTPSGWDRPLGPIYIQHLNVAIESRHLRSACAYANTSSGPPDEWVFLLRSLRGTDARIALIEATTAVEVALARAADRLLQPAPSAAIQRILEGANGVVGLLRLLESLDAEGDSKSRWKRAADRLARPRNLAVHSGSTPTADERFAAQQEALELLKLYSPLPLPSDT